MSTMTMRLAVLLNVALSGTTLLVGCENDVAESRVGKGQMKDFITSAPRNGDSSVPVAQGAEILLRSRRAYDAVQSYAGTITLESTTKYARGPFNETRTLDISFQRPRKLQLDGLDSNGNRYTILCDGQTTTVSAKSLGLHGARNAAKDALVEFSGISLGATTLLPGILLGTKWEREDMFLPFGDILSAFSTNANLEGTESFGEQKCYRIVCPREIATWTFYVDVDSLLIRRVDKDASQEQMRAQTKAGGGGYSGLIISTHTSQLWERTSAADKPGRKTGE